MATARPKQARRRAGAASRTRPRAAATPKKQAPASRHRRELGAIACLAVAVFLAFVLYLGWDGGSLGRWLGDAARWLVGILAFVLPFLLGFAAYVLVVKEESRPRRGMSWGIAFIVAGVALAAAADAFGIFSGERADALFRDAYMSAHGGLLGEAQWAVLSPFIGRVGVDVLVVALVIAGILLVTGSSLRQWATHSRQGVAKAGKAARSQAEALGARRREGADTRVVEPFESATIDAADLIQTSIRPAATPDLDFSRPLPAAGPHLIDGASEAPDIFGEPTPLPEESIPEPIVAAEDGVQLSLAAAAAAAAEKGEGGDAEVALAFADAERRQWTLPDPGRPAAAGAGHRRVPGRRRPRLRAPGVHARELQHPGPGDRHGLRATRDALRAPAGAGHQGQQGGQPQGRPRLRAGRDRRARAGADPGQAGGRRRGPQHPGQLRLARRHPRAVPAACVTDGVLAGQGRHRQGHPRRPRADGAPADRRHHRFRQERLPQRAHHARSSCAPRRTRCA